MRFDIRTDRRLVRPTYRSNRFVLAELTAPIAPPKAGRTPVNLAFVLDRSGSMGGERKIELARQAVEEAIRRLHADDRFAVVVYDEQIEVVVESTTASPEARRHALERLAQVGARGSTNLGEGWLRGCEQVAAHLVADGINRTLLLTDGLANVGITDPEELVRHAAELRARGVATSTIGVGSDFDEVLLERMADAGGGHFYYVSDPVQIPDHITNEVGEALEVVARGATIEVTAPEGVHVEPLSPFHFEARGARTLVSLGDLVSGQELSVVLRLNFPYGEIGREVGALFALTDRDGVFAPAGEPRRLAWAYADNRANDLQERDRDVDRAVARIFAARARQEAARLNKAGRFGEAAAQLRAVASRIGDYAGRDTVLRGLVAELEQDQVAWAAPMAEATRKQHFWAASLMARDRTATGQAVRRRD